MQSKRQLPYDRLNLPPARRLRSNVADMVSRNIISGQRGAELVNDAVAASAQGLDDMVTKEMESSKKNASRKFRRMFQKGGWPPPYTCKVRGWDPKSDTETDMSIDMMLPHEIVFQLHHFGEKAVMLDCSGLDSVSAAHVDKAKEESGESDLIPLGIWQDGVPCFWDRSISCEIVSLLFPGATGKYKNLRIPVTAFSKDRAGPNTFDDIFAVIQWSLQQLAVKMWPASRHDGTAFTQSDTWRSRMRSKAVSLPLGGVLCQIKADWKCMKEVLKLPGWQDDEICFLCHIRKTQVSGTSEKDTHSTRSTPLSDGDLF